MSKDTRGIINRTTDTFKELFLILAASTLLAGLLFAIFEKTSVFNGAWWAIVTAFTVGYGDTVPHTAGGKIVAGALMSFSVFIVIPLITARMASKMIVNDDAFTNKEQEEIKKLLRRINKKLN